MLPAPYMPSAQNAITAYTQGYGIGDTQRRRNLLAEAGGKAAGGNLAGARDTLYRGGEMDEARRFAEMIRQADERAVAKAKTVTDTLGQLALRADTPEKWAAAMDAAARSGMDINKYRDFASRELMLAQAGQAKEAIELEIKRRMAEAKVKPQGYGSVTDPYLAQEFKKRDAARVVKASEAAETAADVNQNLEELKALRDQTDIEGKWQNNPLYRTFGRNFGGGFLGIPTRKEVAALDAMEPAALNVQLGFTEKTKGAITDREMAMFRAAVPGPQMTDAAADNAIRAMRAANARTQARAEFFDAWVRGYGTAEGADAAWNRFIRENPLISGSNRDGSLIVNEQNIANFDRYLQMGPQRRVAPQFGGQAPATAAPAGQDAAPGRQLFINDDTGEIIEWNGSKWVRVE